MKKADSILDRYYEIRFVTEIQTKSQNITKDESHICTKIVPVMQNIFESFLSLADNQENPIAKK